MRSSGSSFLALLACAVLVAGCGRPTCAGSTDPSCHTASPCARLAFTCTGGRDAVRTLVAGDATPLGQDALASPGDVVLENDLVVVVIDAIDHPHYVAPTGGNILDLASQDGLEDSLTHLFHGVGLLPGDTIAYHTLLVDDGPGYAAVEVRGALAGHPEAIVATRYEVRPCEPGVRVRTEIVNGSADAQTWALVDAWYWSGREALPFAPGVGAGFEQDGFRSPLVSSWIPQPYFAAASHDEPATAYGEVACDLTLHGFHAEQLTAVGPEPRVVPPRDVEIFERFLAVEPGTSIEGPIDTLLEVRRQLYGESYTELSGLVNTPSGTLGREVRATLVIEEGTPAMARDERTPVTQVTPGADGRFAARVPAGRDYVIVAEAFGREAATASARAEGASVEVGEITIAGSAEVTIRVTIDGVADHAQVFVTAADDATEEAVRARLFGGFAECAPLLGASPGGSPACDRVLVDGEATVEVPAGRFAFFATAGLFASVARVELDLAAGDAETIDLALETMPLVPAGALSGDFHVHGGASFDSTIPDLDRVAAFLAARVDVIAATDHDVVWDYASARSALGADARLHIISGLEATGHILFDLVPGAELPQVIGHWNVWPMPFDPEGPYRGAPWDELAEPGPLMDRFVLAGWPADTGIVQLNHPWAPAQVGRDLGFPRAVGVDAREPLPRSDLLGWDGTGPGMVLRRVPGAGFGNGDYHTQEVMNGSENEDLMPYRAYWFYLLNQGIVRAGTANSDSHSLVDSVLGTPRTLVWSATSLAGFDEVVFHRAMREGHMIGTNGPVIEASLAGSGPSTVPVRPAASDELVIRVTAAPWVPVTEVRIVVNGLVARTLAAELVQPTDPFGVDPVVRFDGTLALAELGVMPGEDAWIVIEAGEPLPVVADLSCDGIPDTGDNDGDGDADFRDVERNGDDVVDASDSAGLSGPPACDGDADVGPIARTPRGPRDGARYPFAVVTPHGYAYSFTNPFLVDGDGDGFDPPGLPGGAP